MILVFAGQAAAVDAITAYSAVQVETHPNGTERPGQNVYVSGNRIRIVMAESPMDIGSSVFIFMKDLKVIWTLFPEKKTYLEEPWSDTRLNETFKIPPAGSGVSEKGTETIQGYECRRIVVKSDAGKQTGLPSIYWVSPAFKLPLKTQIGEGFVFELRHIKPGPQSPDLYQVPKDFRKAKNLKDAIGISD